MKFKNFQKVEIEQIKSLLSELDVFWTIDKDYTLSKELCEPLFEAIAVISLQIKAFINDKTKTKIDDLNILACFDHFTKQQSQPVSDKEKFSFIKYAVCALFKDPNTSQYGGSRLNQFVRLFEQVYAIYKTQGGSSVRVKALSNAISSTIADIQTYWNRYSTIPSNSELGSSANSVYSSYARVESRSRKLLQELKSLEDVLRITHTNTQAYNATNDDEFVLVDEEEENNVAMADSDGNVDTAVSTVTVEEVPASVSLNCPVLTATKTTLPEDDIDMHSLKINDSRADDSDAETSTCTMSDLESAVVSENEEDEGTNSEATKTAMANCERVVSECGTELTKYTQITLDKSRLDDCIAYSIELEKDHRHIYTLGEQLMKSLFELDALDVSGPLRLTRKALVRQIYKLLDDVDRVKASVQGVRDVVEAAVAQERQRLAAQQAQTEEEARIARAAEAKAEAERARAEQEKLRVEVEAKRVEEERMRQVELAKLKEERKALKKAEKAAEKQRRLEEFRSKLEQETATESSSSEDEGDSTITPTNPIWRKLQLDIPFDVEEAREAYVLSSQVSGLNAKDIHIQVSRDGSTLTVSGVRLPSQDKIDELINRIKRAAPHLTQQQLLPTVAKLGQGSFGVFRKEFSIPRDVDLEDLSWNYVRDTLVITLNKRRQQVFPRQSRGFGGHNNGYNNGFGLGNGSRHGGNWW